jgi:formate hydrogenlyase transcriptional activator
VFPIVNPPLRERKEDVGALVRYFVEKFAKRLNKRIDSIPTSTMGALSRYQWPGNIRELENFIERAVILSRGSTLDAPLAELKLHQQVDSVAVARSLSTLEEAEREHTTLQSKMSKLGIERPADR